MAIDHQTDLSASMTQLTLDEATARGAAVVILCCVPTEGGGEGEIMHIECAIDKDTEKVAQPKDLLNSAESVVRQALVPFQQAGVPARGILCRGEPAEVIVEQSLKLSAGMIIMGRRHLSPFNRLFKSSVSARVLELAHCPVLIDINKQ